MLDLDLSIVVSIMVGRFPLLALVPLVELKLELFPKTLSPLGSLANATIYRETKYFSHQFSVSSRHIIIRMDKKDYGYKLLFT